MTRWRPQNRSPRSSESSRCQRQTKGDTKFTSAHLVAHNRFSPRRAILLERRRRGWSESLEVQGTSHCILMISFIPNISVTTTSWSSVSYPLPWICLASPLMPRRLCRWIRSVSNGDRSLAQLQTGEVLSVRRVPLWDLERELGDGGGTYVIGTLEIDDQAGYAK